MTADDAARPPEVIRRREVRHTSARSLLMTVLGEFVLPADRPVWTWVLVDTLASGEPKPAQLSLVRSRCRRSRLASGTETRSSSHLPSQGRSPRPKS